jgi:hypothetical protein
MLKQILLLNTHAFHVKTVAIGIFEHLPTLNDLFYSGLQEFKFDLRVMFQLMQLLNFYDDHRSELPG